MSDQEKNTAEEPETPRLRKREGTAVATYQWGDEPELVHFIRTRFTAPIYIVVQEDAYQQDPELNGAHLMYKDEIEKKYKITLDI